MKQDCARYDEAIWEHARTGSPLAADAAAHVAGCASCARLLGDARRLSSALPSDDYESSAPDCRNAVTARISVPRAGFRLAWVYACVLALIAVGAAAFLLTTRPTPPSSAPMIAKHEHTKPAPEPKAVPTPPAPHKDVAIAPAVSDTHRPVIRPHRPEPRKMVYRPHLERTAQAHRPPTPSLLAGEGWVEAPPTPSPGGEGWGEGAPFGPPTSDLGPRETGWVEAPPTPSPGGEGWGEGESRPIAAVAVRWPQGDEGTDTSYSYVERDSQTGTVTSCYVKREGNSVEIRLESTPGGGEEPPVKGSIQDEKTINA